jgi:cytochrome c peroxidase
MRRFSIVLSLGLGLTACEEQHPIPHHEAPKKVEAPRVSPVASKVADSLGQFAALPSASVSTTNPSSPEKVELGRLLWFDARLSKNQRMSCNGCHDLAHAGTDGKDFSVGHGGKPLGRNTPSIENAALGFVQFADGRAETLEDATKAVLQDPDIMGGPDDAQVAATLGSMPAYTDAFKKAFPGDAAPITVSNAALAISAFARTLLSPSKWDRFIGGDKSALTDDEGKGFLKFVETGCPQCHVGALVGATMYQKLGKEKPWPDTKDKGRGTVTRSPSDDMMFKVSSLRNVANTAPYFHDASAKTLPEAVKTMAEYQLNKQLSDADIASIVTWLGTLSGTVSGNVAAPTLPPSTPKTPKPPKS